MSHLMFGLKKSNSATTQDEGEDEANVCVLCCHKRSTITVCAECQEHYYEKCIDPHLWGTSCLLGNT